MNILDPKYSFLQFTGGNSPAACVDILPVALNTDLKFQTVIDTLDYAEALKLLTADQKLYVVKEGAVITDEASLAANSLISLANVFTKTQIADTQVLLCWSFGLAGIESLIDNTCFRLCIRTDDTSTNEYFISNCFIKISDLKYTSTLEYYSAEDNYGFNYCNGCENKIRLELYVGSPQPKEVQSVYIKSTGERKLLSYEASKLFELNTNFLSDGIHDKIVNALAHDYINLESSRYTGGIRKDGDYIIGWDNPKDIVAPATTHVYSDAYVSNNNCVDCQEYVNLICVGIISLNATASALPVACAPITSINASAQTQPTIGLFNVSLVRSGSQLTANVTGGTPPYNYHFYCIPVSGTCNDYTISNPNQTTSAASASTNYSYVAYSGVIYDFFVQVLDSAGHSFIAGPNATAMCLTLDTPITMADGSEKMMKDIRKGDELSDIDLETGENVTSFVTSSNNYLVDKIFNINGDQLKASEGHIHIVREGLEFILKQSIYLEVGDKLMDSNMNEVEIESIVIEEGEFKVKTISTTTEQYIANGIITHNKMACP